MLADFRRWLAPLAAAGAAPPAPPPAPPAFDLSTLVAQFTALRHEVNLQTKAARAATEATAEAIRTLAVAAPSAPADDDLRPMVKALLDVADGLAIAARQVDRLRATVEPLLDDLAGEPGGESLAEDVSDGNGAAGPTSSDRPRPGLFARLFGRPTAAAAPPANNARAADAADTLRKLAAAAADGYAMSLRRVERALPTFGLDPIPCIGEAFDPELMEVVDTVDDPDRPPGEVVDQVRAGYLWRGRVFRYAQVVVAKETQAHG